MVRWSDIPNCGLLCPRIGLLKCKKKYFTKWYLLHPWYRCKFISKTLKIGICSSTTLSFSCGLDFICCVIYRLCNKSNDGYHMWNRNCKPFSITWVQLWFLVGLVLLAPFCFLCKVLQIVVCLFWPFWTLHCLSLFYLLFMIIPLVSSNCS